MEKIQRLVLSSDAFKPICGKKIKKLTNDSYDEISREADEKVNKIKIEEQKVLKDVMFFKARK